MNRLNTQDYINKRNAERQRIKALNPPASKKKIKSLVGDILADKFESWGFRPVEGCPCKNLQRVLNNTPVEVLETNLDYWAKLLQESAKKWKELKGGVWHFVPAPPVVLCKSVLVECIEIAKARL